MAQGERIEEPSDAEAVASAAGSLAGLTEQARRLAMARYGVIRPFIEEGVPLEQIAGTQPTNARTLRRWVTRYRRDGLAGLARKERTDRGKPRILNDEAQRLVEGLALRKPPLTVASIHRQVASWLAERGERPPSYGTVRNVIRDLPPSLVTLAHQGGRPKVLSPEMQSVAQALRDDPGQSVATICKTLGIGRTTFYRYTESKQSGP